MNRTAAGRTEEKMVIKIDFNSDEAIYLQVKNQIIRGIAANEFRNGDPLPSVRSLAEDIGVNMHTVNKAYAILRQEGYVKVDRRRGACISVDPNPADWELEIREPMAAAIARASCRGMTRQQIHGLVDEILDEDFNGGCSEIPIEDASEQDSSADSTGEAEVSSGRSAGIPGPGGSGDAPERAGAAEDAQRLPADAGHPGEN
jgi:GntR family transcriptional regulator